VYGSGVTIDAESGYEVRESRIRTVLAVASMSVIPVVFLVAGVLNWNAHPWLLLGGLFFVVIIFGMSSGRIRRAVRRERRFAIGPDGVYLGPGSNGRLEKLRPWADIDFVTHFQGWVHYTGGEYKRYTYVGVIRAGRIVDFHAVTGWSLDVDRAARATTHFGGGIQLVEAPEQPEMPANGYTTISLPPEWLAAQVQHGR
jgi:hypothetical protein